MKIIRSKMPDGNTAKSSPVRFNSIERRRQPTRARPPCQPANITKAVVVPIDDRPKLLCTKVAPELVIEERAEIETPLNSTSTRHLFSVEGRSLSAKARWLSKLSTRPPVRCITSLNRTEYPKPPPRCIEVRRIEDWQCSHSSCLDRLLSPPLHSLSPWTI